MPLNRQILHRVQDLFSRAARGLLRKGGAAEEERAAADMLLSARWASNASASSSMTSTFASSSSASSVRSRASIVSSLSWPDHNCPRDLLRGTQEISLLSRGAVARKRSFLTRPAAVAAGGNGNAGGGRGKRNNKSGSGDRRRSSSTSNAVKTNRRIQPQAPPPPPPSPLARRGQRQWRTLLEDEHPLREEEIPQEIRAIMSKLREAGHSSFVVGGAVRDALLGIRPKDWDVLTTAGPTEISKIIKRATFPLPSSYSPPPPLLSPSSSPPRSNNGDASSFPSSSPPWSVKAWVRVVGARFPVAIVKLRGVVVEVSTLPGAEEEAAAAAEGGGIERSGENESESDVKTSSSSSSLSRSTLPPTLFSALSSNALRRDFTVNALYFDPGTGALHDPTGLGVADALSAKAVRVASALGPSHSFLEDPARGIRAIRLASRARLKLTPAVEAALVSVVVAGGDRSSSSSSSSSSSNLPPSPLLTQVPASRRAHELAALFAHGGSRRALALLWRYGLLDLLLPEHARWLEEARVPRKSGWRNRKRAAEVEGRGEEEGGGEEENDNGDDDGDDDGDGDGGGEGSGTEADSSAKEAATLIPPRLCSNEGETGETKTSPPPPPPPPRLRSLPGVESLAALDVAASASFPAPPALWAAALAMPLVASAALAEEENRRRRRIGGAGLGISDDEDESGGKESVGDESVGDESVGDESVGDESVGDESVGDESGLYLGRPLPSLSTSAPLPSLRRFRALVHAAVESMGGGGHHHVPRAVRAGAEALILRAAAAELDEAEKEKEERKRGGKRETKASLGGGACTRTRRQQSLQGGSRKEVWATVLSGAGKWVAISEGVEGGWGGERDRRGGGGGEKLNLETTTTTKKSVGVVGGEARAAARKKK